MSTTTKSPTDQLEQAWKIAQAMTDVARKQQEMRLAPWQVAFAGMTAGAALFAAGIAFGRFFLGAGP
ncbi:MAG: hypothetical protein K2X11_00475 [Acetobacteraceae bacterium]|nr:hypothetical protein [Acetobacteraceae bacterium]